MCIRDRCNAINKCDFSKCQLPYIQVDLGVTSTIGLIDSGSTRSLISQQLADKLFKHNLVYIHRVDRICFVLWACVLIVCVLFC